MYCLGFMWDYRPKYVLCTFMLIQLANKPMIISATSDNPLLTFESLYTDGINSYLENNWAKCVSYLELALDDWHWWNKSIAKCRGSCYDEANNENLIFSNTQAYELDRVFEKMVVNTLCLVKCKRQVFGSRMDIFAPDEVVDDFRNMKPYDYLQLCYFKQGQFGMAANAAATFLIKQPDHEVMQANLRYYVKDGGLDVKDIIDMEMHDYAKEFTEGDTAYQEERYAESIEHIERSLQLFWEYLSECRLNCENPFDQGWFPDFVSSVANHYTFTLRCKLKCSENLYNFFGEDQTKDFVASAFNYLQYSYFQVGNLPKACEAVETYLALDPEDPSQMRNKQFLWTQKDIKEEYFTARKDVLKYKERIDFERKLMNFIEENFTLLSKGLEQEKSRGSSSSSLEETKLDIRSVAYKKDAVNFYKKYSSLKPVLIADEKALNGSKRFLAGGLLNEDECKLLSTFIQMASVEGDGYTKRKNPHTTSESFQGVTLSRVAMAVHSGLISKSILEAVINATDFSKIYMEQHFHLKAPLYISFTHLVCRTGLVNPSERNMSDLSHVLHADNCILQKDGQCLKIPPAYTFRDYSAVLYLNSDFEGGEFIFSKDRTGQKYESIVKPACGHLLGFSAGKENLHAVRPVLKGTRCALAMWFTFNEKYKEAERSMVNKFLAKLKKGDFISGIN